MVKPRSFVLLTVILQVGLAFVSPVSGAPQGDPCDGNPCGENNICTSNGGAVSCECAPGFANDDPDDPWQCVKTRESNGVIVRGSNEESLIDIPSRTSQTDFSSSSRTNNRIQSTTTDRPSFLPPKETVLGFDESGREVLFTAAAGAPSPANQKITPVAAEPRNPSFTNSINNKNSINQNKHQNFVNTASSDGKHRLIGLDVDQIYNAECLSSEDCKNNEYCNTSVNTCQDACTLNVCGQDSLCKGKLHRPLCYCPNGYEGNPHEVCTKTKSRAGERFRKRRYVSN